MVDVAANYRELCLRIAEAAARAGRDSRDVQLLGAAKSQKIELVRADTMHSAVQALEAYAADENADLPRCS